MRYSQSSAWASRSGMLVWVADEPESSPSSHALWAGYLRLLVLSEGRIESLRSECLTPSPVSDMLESVMEEEGPSMLSSCAQAGSGLGASSTMTLLGGGPLIAGLSNVKEGIEAGCMYVSLDCLDCLDCPE